MEDSCARTIDYLRLSVTDLCNYRCRYCMPEDGVCKRAHSDILSVEDCVEIARAAAACGIRKIRLTGGEPLVRHGILDICRGIGALPGIRELCLTTNGSLLTELAQPLRDAGVTRLNISLDTLRPERFASLTRRGRLSDVLDGIAAAEAAGFDRLKLNTVLIGGVNDDEIPDFVALTQTHPWELRFIELMPMGECRGWDSRCFLPADRVLEVCPTLQPLPSDGVARRYRLPDGAGAVGLIAPLSHRFCGDCNRIRVTADGRLKPCLHSAEELPLKGLHGDALLAQLRAGIAAKPDRHHLIEAGGSDTPRSMNEIGG
ncbi:MAG: GTP 3',8-cyclase MoaA [Oscillospiraceae bacterium]